MKYALFIVSSVDYAREMKVHTSVNTWCSTQMTVCLASEIVNDSGYRIVLNNPIEKSAKALFTYKHRWQISLGLTVHCRTHLPRSRKPHRRKPSFELPSSGALG